MTYHDHHFHPLGYVSMVTGLDLMDARDFADIVARIELAGADSDGPIIGQRLNDEGLAERELPTRDVLDAVSDERPILVYRYCGHIGIANSAALALARIDHTTSDPDGGSFDRSPSGEPTGVLREMGLKIVSDSLAPVITGPTKHEIVSALARLESISIGSVTGMVSAGQPMWCGVGNELETLLELSFELPIDINLIIITQDEHDLRDAAARIQRTDGPIRFGGWKEFSDGSLGGHTAAMYHPYSDQPDQLGTLRLQSDHALTMARTSLQLGGAVAIHAIGDRANDEVLDLFEILLAEGADPALLRIEHASLITEEALRRMTRMRITVSVQPAFLASEEDWLERRLGPDRMALAYRFRSMVEAGLTVLGGSDCPVEPPDPAIGIAAAVDRHGINPAEALTSDQARALFVPPPR